MSEKIREDSSRVVTSNKHLPNQAEPNEDEDLQGYKGGAARGVTLPGAGRPDGPADDGSAGGPTTGGAWGGMQADGSSNTSADEMSVVEDFSRPKAEQL
jgi:hypothetical protein